MGCCCKKRKGYAQYIKEDGKGKELEEKNPSKNKYEIIKALGNGAYGVVFLVRLKSDKTKYFAMKKLLKKKFAKKPHLVKNERDIWTHVKSPFVINIKKAFQDPENLYLVSEYAPGKDLYYHWNNMKPFSLNLTRFYIVELILALEDLHQKNIIHRDIKLENILLDSEGHIKLTDFGFSKFLNDDDKTFTLAGTPAYMAPEVYYKKGHDKTADWWSVGILMFVMLEGSFSFEICSGCCGATEEILYKKPIFKKINDNDKDSINAKDLIQQFLIFDPKKRLGAGENGIKNIKRHAFFERIDWDSAKNKGLKPPFKPDIENIEEVKGRFDEVEVNDEVQVDDDDIYKKSDNYFLNFSFNDDSSDLENDNNDNDNNNNENNDDNNNEKLLDKENTK